MFGNDELDDICWKLFERTGNISYYLLHSKIFTKNDKEDNKWKKR